MNDHIIIKTIQLESYLEALTDNPDGNLDYATMVMLRETIERDAEAIGEQVTQDQLYSVDYIAGMLHAYKTLEEAND